MPKPKIMLLPSQIKELQDHGIDPVGLLPVVNERDEQDPGIVICTYAEDPSPFTDNNIAPCATCGRLVKYRPYVPAHLMKLCIPCALTRMEEDANSTESD